MLRQVLVGVAGAMVVVGVVVGMRTCVAPPAAQLLEDYERPAKIDPALQSMTPEVMAATRKILPVRRPFRLVSLGQGMSRKTPIVAVIENGPGQYFAFGMAGERWVYRGPTR